MSSQQMIPLWGAAVISTVWLWLLIKSSKNNSGASRYKGFWLAMGCWPLLLISELYQLTGGVAPVLAASSVIAVPLVVLAIYRNTLNMLWRKPLLTQWPFYVVGGALLILVPVQIVLYGHEWQQWPGFAPLGDPIEYWAVYLSYLLPGFLVMYIGIVLIEQLQQYHHELPMQVVDTESFRLKGVTGSCGFLVGMAFFLVVLVAAVAFGLLPFSYWLSWFHLGVAAVLLLVISQLVRAHNPSPSPFDHVAMSNAPKMSESTAERIISRAEAAVISHKAYKEMDLTLEAFAKKAGMSASDICLALLAAKKTHFRAFIYQYRMKYAKQVLMGSDAKLDSVTKRLKLGVNGTASQTFLKYLESRR